MITPFYTILTLRTRHEGIRPRSWTVTRSPSRRRWDERLFTAKLIVRAVWFPPLRKGRAPRREGRAGGQRHADKSVRATQTKAPLLERAGLSLAVGISRTGMSAPHGLSTFRPCRRRGRRPASELPSFQECPLPGLRWSTSAPRSNRRWSVRCALPSSDRARPP
jgi:hypothetical protein